MSIALYNNIAKVVAYVVSEVAGVVVEVFLTSVSRGVIDSAEKAVVVIVVSVLDKKKNSRIQPRWTCTLIQFCRSYLIFRSCCF